MRTIGRLLLLPVIGVLVAGIILAAGLVDFSASNLRVQTRSDGGLRWIISNGIRIGIEPSRAAAS